MHPKYLEGTGCFIFDHVGSVAYCMLSERSDESLAHAIANELGFNEVVTFRSVDRQGRPIYHTNVVQAIGTSFAVVRARPPTHPPRLLSLRLSTPVAVSDLRSGAHTDLRRVDCVPDGARARPGQAARAARGACRCFASHLD